MTRSALRIPHSAGLRRMPYGDLAPLSGAEDGSNAPNRLQCAAAAKILTRSDLNFGVERVGAE